MRELIHNDKHKNIIKMNVIEILKRLPGQRLTLVRLTLTINTHPYPCILVILIIIYINYKFDAVRQYND